MHPSPPIDQAADHPPEPTPDPRSPAPAQLSPTVRALGWVSLCTDISSEMVYPLTPLFLTGVLRAPAWTVGLIEGLAESLASVLKQFSGWLSDRAGQRKRFAAAGYLVAAIAKPIIGLAAAWPQVLGARLLDRAGKGLRAAPRDALIAENCHPTQRGHAYGYHRRMDTTGAVLGPLLGYLFLTYHSRVFRVLYLIAFVPAVAGVLVLLFRVREQPALTPPFGHPSPQLGRGDGGEGLRMDKPPRFAWHGLAPAYRRYLWIVLLFGIGNSSDAFLLLRAQSLGVSAANSLLLYTLFNLVEASFGQAAGRLSDRWGRRPLLIAGYGAFALVYLGFALARDSFTMWPLFAAYGIYYTLTQGTQKALVADLVHPDRRGAETGTFDMLVGLAALPASLLAGLLYARIAPAAPFYLGAATAFLAALWLWTARLDRID